MIKRLANWLADDIPITRFTFGLLVAVAGVYGTLTIIVIIQLLRIF